MRLFEYSPDMLLFYLCALFSVSVSGTSIAVGTSAIITTYTSIIYQTTSSFVSNSVSQRVTGTTCETSTDANGAPYTINCVSATAATDVPIYQDVVHTITSTIESAVGYSTIYSSVADPVSTVP